MTTDNIATVKFTDIEATLAERFGDRFLSYRRDYRHSLNYEETGYIPDFPITVSIELVNRCNLKCIMCWTENHNRVKATMSIGTIDSILRECQAHETPAAVIGMGSEALLYKEIRDVIMRTRDAGVMDVFLGTNATLLTEDLAEFIVDQEVARVEVSLDAATPETYKVIRSKDELSLVEQNVRKLIDVRNRKGKKLPIVRLCFCVQPENVHEREAFRDKWASIVDYVDFQEMSDFSHVDTLLAGKTEQLPPLPELTEKPHCSYPFNSLSVWSDGQITPCCSFYGKAIPLGNIHDMTLKEAWEGEKLKKLRAEFLSGEVNTTCKVCLSQRDTINFDKATGDGPETT